MFRPPLAGGLPNPITENVTINDDFRLYFGTANNSSIRWNAASTYLQITSADSRFSGSLTIGSTAGNQVIWEESSKYFQVGTAGTGSFKGWFGSAPSEAGSHDTLIANCTPLHNAGATNSVFRSMKMLTQVRGTQNYTNNQFGGKAIAWYEGSATLSGYLAGFEGEAGGASAGTTSTMVGLVGRIANTHAGAVGTVAIGLWAPAFANVGTYTTSYGLKVDAPGVGTTQYTMAVADGNSYCAGPLRVGMAAAATGGYTFEVTGASKFATTSNTNGFYLGYERLTVDGGTGILYGHRTEISQSVALTTGTRYAWYLQPEVNVGDTGGTYIGLGIGNIGATAATASAIQVGTGYDHVIDTSTTAAAPGGAVVGSIPILFGGALRYIEVKAA